MITQRYAQRGDAAANWAAVNPILAQNEIGVDTTNGRFKIGNGATPWNSLAYAVKPTAVGALRGAVGDRYLGTQAPQGSITPVVNREYGIPFILPAGRSVADVQVYVSTAQPSSSLRVGWRSDASGWPGSLMQELGAIDTTATGARSLSVTFAPGSEDLWWLTITAQGASATLAQNAANPTAFVTIPRPATWGTSALFVPVRDGVTGGLPVEYGARASTMTGNHPAVQLTLA